MQCNGPNTTLLWGIANKQILIVLPSYQRQTSGLSVVIELRLHIGMECTGSYGAEIKRTVTS
jgi:hypothetical protein